ncbi:MAG: polysaccharide biosynthesis tyrosine autokinase, partial [Kiritimatiellae bacterium]|nr:polysaccharide biosynthesis tyrosine autokinase [Kiritimatiellia bacterium]
ADAYLEENRTLAANANGGDTGGLGEKAGDLRVRLDDAEAALRAFADENDLGSFEDTKLLAGERYRDLAKNLVAAESRRIAAETQFDSAREALESGSAVESIPGVLESPVVTSIKLELAALQRQESDLAALDGDADAPARLKSVRAQTAALQAQIRAEAERLVESLRARLEQLKGEESLLRDALDEQKKQVAGFNGIDARYRLLLQTRDSLRESYDSVSRSLDELDTANLANQGDSVFVVAQADVPGAPSWPNRPKMLVLGLFFGLLFGIGVCFILDFFDTSVKTAADVHACVRRPLLGSVPAKCGRKKAPNDFYAIDHPHSAFAEAFRTICTRLSFSAAGGPVRSLVVSSAGPAEGKSLCALNLAIACAQSSKRVLLVDADLRTPALAKVFPDAPAKGLSDLLAEGLDSLSTTVASTQIPNLSFLPAGTIPPNPVALLDSPRFADLLQTLSSQYDLVVFDTPSCLDKVDALVLAKQAGGLVYVLRASASNKFSTRQSIRQLETANVPILGAILNGVSA